MAAPVSAPDFQQLLTVTVGLNVGQLYCVIDKGFTSLT